jgi:hypothetical protein
MTDCTNDCSDNFVFPRRPENRPGLSRIDYRIGTYPDFREALFRNLNKNQVLEAWTHRDADDPGIALLEGASILGDILTFYQELYANEAYLGTAKWRESIADLVRLTGYRLSPGIGGHAVFAFEVKGDKPVIIPGGFQVKAQLEGSEKPEEFETASEVKAYPHLSRFHLYGPRLESTSNIQFQLNANLFSAATGAAALTNANNSLEIKSVGGRSDLASIRALDIKAGDRIMLVPDTSMFDVTGKYKPQDEAQILIISKVKNVLDRIILIFEGSLSKDYPDTQVIAYRIGRSFHHFGHNAPAMTTKFDSNNKTIDQVLTESLRSFCTDSPVVKDDDYYTRFSVIEMPLDSEVQDLSEGSKLICQGYLQRTISMGIDYEKKTIDEPFTVIKKIESVRSDSPKWGNLTGASIVVTLESKLITNDEICKKSKWYIRKIRFHEGKSLEMKLGAPTPEDPDAFEKCILNFFGTYAQVQALMSRDLLLVGKDGKVQKVNVTDQSFSLDGKDEIQPWMWQITLDSKPDFPLTDFDEEKPEVTVYGNLVEATQGKTEKEKVLGNGDSRQAFQTFKLPKSPLTYLLSAGETPPHAPELSIYVNDRLWKRVPSFFGKGYKDEIYIVREDANGESWVQFGDGKTGARLPSGIKNVAVRYRTGTGAFGALKEGSTVQGGRLEKLDKIQLAGEVTGGLQPENGDKAKEVAPGKMQSLGRLVSLGDFEAEALSIPSVLKASAEWDVQDYTPAFIITILMETGKETEKDELQEILNKYNKCRGAFRFPVMVVKGMIQYVSIDVDYGFNPIFKQDVLEKIIKGALGVAGESDIDGSGGLFGVSQRTFGQNEYATSIEGTIQNVEGVAWAKVNRLESLGSGDPAKLKLSLTQDIKLKPVICGNENILGLYFMHLHLNGIPQEHKEVC